MLYRDARFLLLAMKKLKIYEIVIVDEISKEGLKSHDQELHQSQFVQVNSS